MINNDFCLTIMGALDKAGLGHTVEEVVGFALQAIKDKMDCRSCGILGRDTDGTVKVIMSRGLSGAYIKRIQSTQMPLVDEVMSSGATIMIGKDHPLFNMSGYLMEEPYKILLAMPIKIKGSCIGVFMMDSEKNDFFPVEHREGISEFISFLALLVYQESLENRLAEASNVDFLTSVYNYKYFYDELNREIMKSQRHMHPTSIIIASIGHIGDYNSAHGHAEGDREIIAVSKMFLTNVKPVDIVSRYGGKFAVMLPEMEKPQALEIAEKIRVEMESAYKNRKPSLSIRIGVASYPADSSDMKELISVAEKNLYESKRKGGNSVTG